VAQQCSARAEELGAYACVVAANSIYGAAASAMEKLPNAKPALERGSELCRMTNMAPFQTLTRALLGSARAELGDLPGGVADWDEALAAAKTMNDRWGEAQTLRGRALSLAKQSNPDWTAVLVDIESALRLLEAMGARPSVARVGHERADVLRHLGRNDEADVLDRAAKAQARELGLLDAVFA
jgi:hypothetical protein